MALRPRIPFWFVYLLALAVLAASAITAGYYVGSHP